MDNETLSDITDFDQDDDVSIRSLDDELQSQPDVLVQSQENAAQSSQNPGVYRARRDTSEFKKVPEFEAIFVRKGYDENRNARIECNKCNHVISANRYSRYVKHIKECLVLDEQTRIYLLNAWKSRNTVNTGNDNLRRNLKLAKVILENNSAIRMIASLSWKDFIQDLDPEYKCADRETMSSELIPMVAERYVQQFTSSMFMIEDFSLSIEFDKWTDLVKRSVFGILCTKAHGQRYLLDLQDLSSKSQTAENIIIALRSAIEEIPPIKINALISDAGSNVKAAREKLVLEPDFSHIIEHRCFAHYLNLIGQDMVARDPYNHVVEHACYLINYLANDSEFLDHLKKKKINRPETVTSTRWYSVINLLESLLRCREEAANYLKESSRRRKKKIRLMVLDLEDQDFDMELKKCINYLKPLVECISVAQREDGSLGEAMKALLDYMRDVFTSNWSNPYVLASAKSLLDYFNTDKIDAYEMRVMLAAYFLDRRNQMNYITKHGCSLVLKAILEIAAISHLPGDSLETSLYHEFKAFKFQQGSLSKFAQPDQRSHDWWQQQCSNRSNLKVVALRLANLKSSSANIERLFSMVRYIQGLCRTQFSMESLTNVARTKLAMTQKEIDEEADYLFLRQEEEAPVTARRPLNSRRRTLSPNARFSDRSGSSQSGSSSQSRNSSQLRQSSRIRELSQSPEDPDDLDSRCSKLEGAQQLYYIELLKMIDFDIITQAREQFTCDSVQSRNINIEATIRRFEEDLESASID